MGAAAWRARGCMVGLIWARAGPIWAQVGCDRGQLAQRSFVMAVARLWFRSRLLSRCWRWFGRRFMGIMLAVVVSGRFERFRFASAGAAGVEALVCCLSLAGFLPGAR